MIREVPDKDIERAINLVNTVFSEFVATDYSEQGRATFASYLKVKHQEVGADLTSGRKRMWAYYHGDDIIGVIATQDVSHISLMFVDKRYHRQGIAKQMFLFVLEVLKEDENVTKITVNSSLYAVGAYEHLGFTKTAEQQEKDGILFVPMMRPLYSRRS
ncbi:MAG: GNAT family N-acetyltransferase [Oscillospiraceae bacterium]|nr:GNAT family N-acetyltransferase [Oscillospiraceae bacterium]